MSYMLEEIHEQPDIIRRVVDEESQNVAKLAGEIRKRDIHLVIIAARGTSDNAAIYSKYLFEIVNGLPTSLAAMSVLTLYGSKIRLDHALVVGISQSGQAPDVVEYLEQAKSQGALTVAITNEFGSRITQAADYTIYCHARTEKSVAATKTYTSTLAASYLLSAKLLNNQGRLDTLLKATDQMREVFSLEEQIKERVQRYRYMDGCFVISRGINHCTAFEASLKMAETSYVASRAYSAADFLHGPIAVLYEDIPCFLYVADGKAFDMMVDMIHKVKSKGAETIVIAHKPEAFQGADTAFRMPAVSDELVSPMVYIVAGQLFAYYLSEVKGHDPDHPRGLKKVTLTR